MGEVYLAMDTRLGRQVAIKVLPAHLASDASARERLRREALAAAALDHPYICKLFDIEEREVLFLVMEFIDGQTTRDLRTHFAEAQVRFIRDGRGKASHLYRLLPFLSLDVAWIARRRP